jgi:NADH dehydrogenase [ubiquinone] 1 alpha subcomplex assembly factor 7
MPTFLAAPFDLEIGEVAEVAPARDKAVAEMATLINKATGAALIVDYGYEEAQPGETLQAMRAHEFAGVLEEPGEADLTAHVDFSAIRRAAGLRVRGPVTQGEFLQRLGIGHRAAILKDEAGLKRLTDPAEMGALFKVAALCHDNKMEIAGFEGDE